MTDGSENVESKEDRLDAILAEYLQAADSGSAPEQQQYASRYPEFEADLREFFAHRQEFERATGAFRPASFPATSAVIPAHELAGDAAAPTAVEDESAIHTRVHYFGEYELLQEVGRGGMGVVYKARQLRLGRIVALKMILAGRFASHEEVKRFQVEAENAALLDHPNIVPVYEVGRHKGQHYFTMKFVEGGSLTGQRARFKDSPKAAAQFIATVARAVHYGHQRGILHRDLKPGNILIGSDGQPQITDFGLARRMEDDDGLTLSGTLVGSPKYMSPEQARSEKVLTVAADVWGLGAVLYELLTGTPPFNAGTILETLRQVREQSPASPSSLNPRIDRDLETACLKCLEKESPRRYASAEALADDLDRWRAGKPVLARPVGSAVRAWRCCRRNPTLTAVAAIAALGISTAIITLAIALVFIRRSRDDNIRLANQQVQLWSEKQSHVARLALEHALAKCQTTDAAEGLPWLARALQEAVSAKDRALERSVRQQLAAWAAQVHPLELLRRASAQPSWLPTVFSDDGSRCLIAEGSDGGFMRVHDIAAARSLGSPIPWNDASYRASLSHDGRFVLVLARPDPIPSPIAARIFDVNDGTLAAALVSSSSFHAAAFHPDGKSIVTIDEMGLLQRWDLGTGRKIGQSVDTRSADGAVAWDQMVFSADGRWLFTAGDGLLRRWYVDGWGTSGPPLRREVSASALAVSADGALILVAEGSRVLVWGRDDYQMLDHLLEHGAAVTAVALSPDGAHVLTGGVDHAVRLWAVSTASQIGAPMRMTGTVRAVAFAAQGRAAVASDESEVRGWALHLNPAADKSAAAYIGAPVDAVTAWAQVITSLEVDADGVAHLCDAQSSGPHSWEERRRSLSKLGGAASAGEGPLFGSAQFSSDPGGGGSPMVQATKPPTSGPAGASAAPAVPTEAAQWRIWGGSAKRNAVSPGKDPPVHWDAEKGQNILWSADLGSKSYGEPIVADGVVYVGTNNELHRDPAHGTADGGVLMAFDAETGRFLWQRYSAKLATGRVNDWPDEGMCSPVYVENGVLWYATNRCEVVCLDVKLGRHQSTEPKVLWSVDMIGQLGVFPHNMTRSAIVSYQDYIYVMTANGVEATHMHVVAPNAPGLVCLDKNTGRVVWSDNSPGRRVLHSQWANVALAEVNGRMLVIAPMGDAWVRAFDALTGRLIWKFDINPKESIYPQTRNEILAAPVIAGNRMYIGSGQDPEHGEGLGHFYCVRIDKEGDISAQLSPDDNADAGRELLADDRTRAREKPTLNPNSGVIWHFGPGDASRMTPVPSRMHRTTSTAVVYRGLVYVPDFSGFLHCLDAQTGRHEWSADLGSALWSSPLAVEGKIYLGDEGGMMHVYQAGNRLLEMTANDLGGPIYTSAIFVNRTLYMMRRDKLFAIRGAPSLASATTAPVP